MAFSIASLAPLSFGGGAPAPLSFGGGAPARLSFGSGPVPTLGSDGEGEDDEGGAPAPLNISRVTPGERAYNLACKHFREENPHVVHPLPPYISPSNAAKEAGHVSPLAMPPAVVEGGAGGGGGGMLKKSCSFKGIVKVASYDSDLSLKEKPLILQADMEMKGSGGGGPMIGSEGSEGSEAATPRE